MNDKEMWVNGPDEPGPERDPNEGADDGYDAMRDNMAEMAEFADEIEEATDDE